LLGAREGSGQTDGQLLERFVAQLDETAFATLVERHGPLVFNVCRRLLGHAEDVEDAFQGTFLVLVRKARKLDKRGSLAGWLYGVAYRIAVRARANAARRRALETRAVVMQTIHNGSETTDPELRQVIDEELSRLPEKYRSPLVLCYLQGKSHTEAADQLQWPVGTVRGRMARARTILRGRLARRGLSLPGGIVAATLASNKALAAVPVPLVKTTVQGALLAAAKTGAAGAFSARAVALSEAILREMAVTKLKIAATVLLTVAVTGAGAGLVTYHLRGQHTPGVASQGDDASVPAAAVNSTQQPFRHLATDSIVHSIAFAPDGRTLASAGADGTVHLWDIPQGREKNHLPRQHQAILAVAFAPFGNILVTGSETDDKVQLWDPGNSRNLGQLAGHYHGVRTLRFSADGRLLAAAGPGQQILVWNMTTRQKTAALKGPAEGTIALAFFPDNQRLASAGNDKLVRIWNVTTGMELQTFRGHQGHVTSVVCFPEGDKVASASGDKTIRLWAAGTELAMDRWEGPAGISSLVLTRDGLTLVSGGGDGIIRLWNTATGAASRQLQGHTGGVAALALSPDGHTLASAGTDRTICLWQMPVLIDAGHGQEVP
jgi:RNA polymerase sigma factor (sigma-70 family)